LPIRTTTAPYVTAGAVVVVVGAVVEFPAPDPEPESAELPVDVLLDGVLEDPVFEAPVFEAVPLVGSLAAVAPPPAVALTSA
jgi:hypothetical protein